MPNVKFSVPHGVEWKKRGELFLGESEGISPLGAKMAKHEVQAFTSDTNREWRGENDSPSIS